MRDYILLFINGRRHEVRGQSAFLQLSDYLRYEAGLTGTKVVCAEGDCGACTVLKSTGSTGAFRGINSCISPVFVNDASHIVTVEGISDPGQLTAVQKAMVDCYGSQCGFCTPGFVMALTDMFERSDRNSAQEIKNHLTGNLCRCTGYQPIIDAALQVEPKKINRIRDRYANKAIAAELQAGRQNSVCVKHGHRVYHGPATLSEALAVKAKANDVQIYSGGTDLGVRDNKRTDLPQQAMSLHLIDELYAVEQLKNGRIFVGAKANLRQLEEFCRQHIPELGNFLRIFASPQIKESATLIGNLVNGSPIADTLPFLFVSDAEVLCTSSSGQRRVKISDFFRGYKELNIKPDELVVGCEFSPVPKDARLGLYKVSSRRDLDISTVNLAILAHGKRSRVESLKICYGGVGPVPLRVTQTEKALSGQAFDRAAIDHAAPTLKKEITPISDVRGSLAFRHTLAVNLIRKFCDEWQHGQ